MLFSKLCLSAVTSTTNTLLCNEGKLQLIIQESLCLEWLCATDGLEVQMRGYGKQQQARAHQLQYQL